MAFGAGSVSRRLTKTQEKYNVTLILTQCTPSLRDALAPAKDHDSQQQVGRLFGSGSSVGRTWSLFPILEPLLCFLSLGS
jgi:hypothetical protein